MAFKIYWRHAQSSQQRRRDAGNPEPVSHHAIPTRALHETLEQEGNRHLLLAGWNPFHHAANGEPEPVRQLYEAFGNPRPDVSRIATKQFVGAFPDERHLG